MKRSCFFAWMLTVASIFALTACTDGKPSEERHARAIQQIQNAYEDRDYQELLRLADSLCTIGELSEPEAYYWQGYACDRTKQMRMAEFYWKTAVAQTSNSTAPEDLAIYAKSASHLANVLGSRGEYDVVLDIIRPVVERLKEQKCDTMSDYNNLVLMIGLCQSRFGLSRDVANESYEQAYQTHLKNIEEHRSDEAYKNAIAGVVNIAYNCNETQSYKDAIQWIDRYGELIQQYEQRNADPVYVDRQWARYDIYRAIALDGLGKNDEAAKVYEHYLTTQYSQTPEGRIAVNDYLIAAGQWTDVADNYGSLDALLGHKDYSIEDFQKMVLPKFKANLQAGRRDSAMAVALDISHSLDSAITQARKQDAQELAVIRQKAEKLAADEALATRQRTNNLFLALALVFCGFAIYTYYRHLKTLRGIKKHRELKEAYNELETTKTMVNKGILEQDIARNIQLAMTPDAPPQHDDIRLFASLKPADETDIDLYDYFVSNDKFFFCIGDAKGTGINASTAMAITRTEFRSLASDKTEPAEIVTSINKKLTDRENPDMAVTLLVGILDLTTGRLRYTNAEQTAPLLVGSGIGLLPVDQNAAVGTHADFRYTTQETRIDPGTLIFLYTQDLLEAKNEANDTYGQRRMLGESLQASKMLSKKLSPETFDKWMKDAISRFTGKEAEDVKLTMFTIQYKQVMPGGPYQRSISFTNDPKDEAYISYFTNEVCAAVGLNEKLSAPITANMEAMVKDIAKQAYPDGTKGDIHIEARTEDNLLKFVVSAADKELTLTKEIAK